MSLLKEIAETPQGRLLQAERDLLDVFRREGAPQRTRLPIRELLLALVVILLSLYIALRRVALSREQVEAILSRVSFGGWLFRRPVPATSADTTQKTPEREEGTEAGASAYTRRLLEAKRQAQGQASRPSESDSSDGKN